jgi:hypothetical protein
MWMRVFVAPLQLALTLALSRERERGYSES